MTVKNIEMSELDTIEVKGAKLSGDNFDLIKNVKVNLQVYVGQTEMAVEELFNLKDGSVVPIDRLVDEPVEILLDGKTVALGYLVAAEDNFGVRITKIEKQND